LIIVLDWDGTLVDSADVIVQCMRDGAQSVGLVPPAPLDVRQIIGLGLPEAISALFPDVEPARMAQVGAAYSSNYRQSGLPPLFSGVEDTLDGLLELGCLLAIATGKGRKGLDRELHRRGFEGRFHVTRCADETASKPDPRMLHEILQATGKRSEEAVMVGDTEFDMHMASRAGMRKVAVTYGAHSPAQLARCQPDLLVDEFSAILDWVSGQGR
jgi:phosphoglycolate phosphatase